jgi:hypothetical protein
MNEFTRQKWVENSWQEWRNTITGSHLRQNHDEITSKWKESTQMTLQWLLATSRWGGKYDQIERRNYSCQGIQAVNRAAETFDPSHTRRIE